ncbi:MAG: c-type cytochrome, partial [Pirellulales bacterium]
LVARYDGGGAVWPRRDEAVQFVWGDAAPDERLPPGEFSARWQGQLLVLSPGKHRFYLYAAGHVALEMAGTRLIQGESAAPRWFESSSIDLEFGHQPLTIRFSKMSDKARVGLYWSGPQFELEPVPARLLFHEPANDPGDAFERGAELWRTLRCDNCHGAARYSGLRGPSLAGLPGNISSDWLIDWLLSLPVPPGERTGHPHPNPLTEGEGTGRPPLRRMPRFGLGAQEAAAIADYLLNCGAGVPPATSDGTSVPPDRREQAGRLHHNGDARRGQRLFFTLGCLACHQVGKIGTVGLFGGGDLSRIADKRPADFFGRWLRDPAAINADHRMPVFRLSDVERDDLAAWLATLRRLPPTQAEPIKKSDAAAGKRLVEALRCGNCHALPAQADAGGRPSERIAIPLGELKHGWQETC